MGKYDEFRKGSLFAEDLRDVEEGLSQFEEIDEDS